MHIRVKKHLTPFFTGRKAHQITTADVQTYIQNRLSAGASNAEINRELAALKRMYNLALRAEKIAKKPYIPKLEEDNARQGFFEPWEFEAVLAQLPEYLRPIITFAYYTGWRTNSEILPLTWDRVDIEAGTVRLYRGTTNNKDGRLIHLPQVLRDILERQWEEHLTYFPECPLGVPPERPMHKELSEGVGKCLSASWSLREDSARLPQNSGQKPCTYRRA